MSPEPHYGLPLVCESATGATRSVSSVRERGRALRLRGINAWVVKSGDVRVGDDVRALFEFRVDGLDLLTTGPCCRASGLNAPGGSN